MEQKSWKVLQKGCGGQENVAKVLEGSAKIASGAQCKNKHVRIKKIDMVWSLLKNAFWFCEFFRFCTIENDMAWSLEHFCFFDIDIA